MILQQLKLHNIRSYTNQTITFPQGSMVLAGDIGSGKSTLLLSIEFALFGISRPDLSSEHLLRKGTNEGFVELSFKLFENIYTIKRSLRKDAQGIKQLAGYILINNSIKKELTPVELKAEIVSLLGYPEESVSKSKNYIFRYTVYTPQEEMKLILQEDDEIRLDVLRKIFNVDKYKNVRENTAIFLKILRGDLALLKERTKDLSACEERLIKIEIEKKEKQEQLFSFSKKLEQFHLAINTAKEHLLLLKAEQKVFEMMRNELKTTLLILVEKERTINQLKEKKGQIEEKISSFAFPQEEEIIIKRKVAELELKKKDFYTTKSSLEQSMQSIQRQMISLKSEIILLEKSILELPSKVGLLPKLTEEIAGKENYLKKKEELEESISYLLQKSTLYKNDILNAQKIMQNISQLQNCPTCLQQVSLQHKAELEFEQSKIINDATSSLQQIKEQEGALKVTRLEVLQKIEEINSKEKLITILTLEIKQLEEKEMQFQEKKKLLEKFLDENQELILKLTNLEKEIIIPEVDEELFKLKEKMNLFIQKKFLHEQLTNISQQIMDETKKGEELANKKIVLEMDLLNKKNHEEQIKEDELKLDGLLIQERKDMIEKTQCDTMLKNFIKLYDDEQTKITQLHKEKEKLTYLQNLHHWLEEYFLNLTQTIEKEVMTSLHHLFNSIFQEWFSILIDEENVYAHLDDRFTPIVEQNGFEVNFFNLSGGEKTSTALAYRLALNKVINDVIHTIKTKDLLILDEPTDGFSTQQLDKVRDVLERLHVKQIIIVSHEPKIESFVENVIRVGKNGHVSSVG